MALYLEGIDAPHPKTKVFLDKKNQHYKKLLIFLLL